MEKSCVIFCAGGFDGLLAPIPAEAFVIAADGGLKHAEALGLAPDVILGDFDSLGYFPEGDNVLRHPVQKDDTDSMLAIRLGLERGCTRFFLYGALDGERLDHTVANFQALEFLAQRGGTGYLVGRDYLAAVVRNGGLRFPKEAGGIISVFCLGPDAEGVTLKNLLYPLENAVLTAGFPLGVSNHFTGTAAEISVEKGSLLLLWPRSAGLPVWDERRL